MFLDVLVRGVRELPHRALRGRRRPVLEDLPRLGARQHQRLESNGWQLHRLVLLFRFSRLRSQPIHAVARCMARVAITRMLPNRVAKMTGSEQAVCLLGLCVLVLILGYLIVAFVDQVGDDGGVSTTVPVELIALPPVTGMSVSDAERDLLGLDLQVTIVERPNGTVPRGEVVQQSPLAGQKVEPRSEVTLFVSAGAPDQVPNVIGMDQTSALDMLESLGYSATVEFVSDVREFGEVVTQLPAPGTELPAGRLGSHYDFVGSGESSCAYSRIRHAQYGLRSIAFG